MLSHFLLMVIREKEMGTGAHLPVVAQTAQAMNGDEDKCLAFGMDGKLTKPIGDGMTFSRAIWRAEPSLWRQALARAATISATFPRRTLER